MRTMALHQVSNACQRSWWILAWSTAQLFGGNGFLCHLNLNHWSLPGERALSSLRLNKQELKTGKSRKWSQNSATCCVPAACEGPPGYESGRTSFFPNSTSFGVFSHSKGFGAELLPDSLWFSGADPCWAAKRFCGRSHQEFHQGFQRGPPKLYQGCPRFVVSRVFRGRCVLSPMLLRIFFGLIFNSCMLAGWHLQQQIHDFKFRHYFPLSVFMFVCRHRGLCIQVASHRILCWSCWGFMGLDSEICPPPVVILRLCNWLAQKIMWICPLAEQSSTATHPRCLTGWPLDFNRSWCFQVVSTWSQWCASPWPSVECVALDR